MTIQINEELAFKVKETISYGLCKGLGEPIPGQMCVEAAVNYACGFEHGDEPICVGRAVRAFKIRLNDANWSSNDARAKGMKKIAIAQLGSNTIDQIAFTKIVVFKTITVLMSVILRDNGFKAEAMLCESSKNFKEAKINIRLVKNNIHINGYVKATVNAAIEAVNYYADIDNPYSDSIHFASIGDTAAAYSASTAVAANDTDKYFIISADICLEALKELKSPGCEFLYVLN